jgi:hypothetical protein
MPRFNVNAMVAMSIIADTSEHAEDLFCATLSDVRNGVSWHTPVLEVAQAEYEVPAGAERWAAAARYVDFDNDRESLPQRLCGHHDGSWWWTNGHVLLRCEGSIPSGDDWRKIEPQSKFVEAFALSEERAPSGWGDELPDSTGSPYLRGRCATANPEFHIQCWYFDLISMSVPDAVWMVPVRFDAPAHVLDKEGKLVAIVMGLRKGSVATTPLAGNEKEGV